MKRILILITFFVYFQQLCGSDELAERDFMLEDIQRTDLRALGCITVRPDDLICDVIKRIGSGDYNKAEGCFINLEVQPTCLAVQNLYADIGDDTTKLDPNLTVRSTGLWNIDVPIIRIDSHIKKLSVRTLGGHQKTIVIKSTLSTKDLAEKIKEEFGTESKINMKHEGKSIAQAYNILIAHIENLWENPVVNIVIHPAID